MMEVREVEGLLKKIGDQLIPKKVWIKEEKKEIFHPIPQYIDFNVILSEEEEGGFSVECPKLPGCVSQGETEKEAIENIKDAITGYLECAERNKVEIDKWK